MITIICVVFQESFSKDDHHMVLEDFEPDINGHAGGELGVTGII